MSYQQLGAGTPLRIVQITDTHLFAGGDGCLLQLNTRNSLELTLNHLQSHHWPVDLVLATGDLVHDGSETGYAYFQERFSRFDAPVYCIPGNHDEAKHLHRQLNGGCLKTVKQAVHGAWAFVFLDSNRPNSPGGYLNEEQIPLLSRSLEQLRDKHVLVVLHHHPVPLGSSWLDTMAVSNADTLYAALADTPQVKGIICGHVHQAYDAEHHGKRLLACPSTCIQFLPGSTTFTLDSLTPGYRWLELHPDGRIETGVERIEHYPERPDVDSEGYA